MVIVTGTRRSGTSMWMQILQAAGLPIVGELEDSVEFPVQVRVATLSMRGLLADARISQRAAAAATAASGDGELD